MTCPVCDDAAAAHQIVLDIQEELYAAQQVAMLLDMLCMECQMGMSATGGGTMQMAFVSTPLDRTKAADVRAVHRGLGQFDTKELIDQISTGGKSPRQAWAELMKQSGIKKD